MIYKLDMHISNMQYIKFATKFRWQSNPRRFYLRKYIF